MPPLRDRLPAWKPVEAEAVGRHPRTAVPLVVGCVLWPAARFVVELPRALVRTRARTTTSSRPTPG